MTNERHAILPRDAEPCVWMSAGMVTYKLCDRDFDCDHCPLDVSLRGNPPEGAVDRPGATAPWNYPADRSYSSGHLWIQPRSDDAPETCRIGLDALAASLLGACRKVRWSCPRELARGEPFCELELDVGSLSLGAPKAGRLEAHNEALADDPASILANPYEGWLVEMRLQEATEKPWLPATAARERSELDLRRFRRGAALRMLVDRELGPVLADGGSRLTDLRQMVGPAAYLELLRDLIR